MVDVHESITGKGLLAGRGGEVSCEGGGGASNGLHKGFLGGGVIGEGTKAGTKVTDGRAPRRAVDGSTKSSHGGVEEILGRARFAEMECYIQYLTDLKDLAMMAEINPGSSKATSGGSEGFRGSTAVASIVVSISLIVHGRPRSEAAIIPRKLHRASAPSSVKTLIDDAKSGLPLNVAGISGGANSTASNSLPSMFPAGSAPPLSPRSSTGSPRFMKRALGAGPSSLCSPLKIVSETVKEVIPQFYFQNGRPPPSDLKEQCLSRIEQIFLAIWMDFNVKILSLLQRKSASYHHFFLVFCLEGLMLIAWER